MGICEYCHRDHDGKYASGRFCSPKCSSKSRRKNRAKTIAKKKKQGTYKKNYTPISSKLQKRVITILRNNNIKCQTQFRIGKYYYDIKIGNILIQVQGTYWHLDPRIYQASQIVIMPGNTRVKVSNKWKKDLSKKLQAIKRGFRVLYLWQIDINSMTEQQLVQCVKSSISADD